MNGRRRGVLGGLLLVGLAAVGVVAGELTSNDPAELFVSANQAYEAGDYQRAIGLYSDLLTRGVSSGHVHYDLGNAYLRNGELGQAIASYLRAQRRLPRDEDVRANLAFARQSGKDALEPPGPSAVASTLFFWHFAFSPREVALAAVVLNALFWLCLGARLVRPGSETLRWLAVGLLVPLLALAGSLVARIVAPVHTAVVIPQEVEAKTAPDDGGVVRFKLHAGTEVRVRASRDGWVRVALPEGEQGWVRAEWVEIVDG